MSWRLGWPWALSLFVACLLVLLPAGSGADVAVDADRAPQLVIMNGRVTDLLSGEAIVGARVAAGNGSAETDSDGRYQIELVPGTHDLTIRAKGYIGVTYTAFSALLGSTTALDVQLTPDQPSPEVDALLASMLPETAQELPHSPSATDTERGYGLSSVTEIPETIRVLMPDGNVTVMLIDEYLKGVLPQEVPHSWPMEALKAQAIAARSYASTRHAHEDQGADVCTTHHCQVWSNVHYDTTDQAVDETHGIVATYNDQIISAFFFSHCDGHTRNSEDVWTAALPYCRSVACPCGFDEMYGHGVGMCQWGSYAMAQQGAEFDDIVRHYYSGVDLTLLAEPELADAGVTPSSGTSADTYSFSVRYVHPLGDAPTVAEVEIDGRALGLIRDATDHTLYGAQTQLNAGEHQYAFYLSDGHGHVVRWPESGTATVTVTVSTVSPTLVAPTLPAPSTGSADIRALAWSTPIDWEAGTLSGGEAIAQGNGALTMAEGVDTTEFESDVVNGDAEPFVALAGGFAGEWPDGASIGLEIRVQDGVSWDEWQPLPQLVRDVTRTGLFLTEPIFLTGQQAQMRLRLDRAADGSAPTVDSLRLYLLNTANVPSVPSGQPGDFVTRAEWGADEAIMSWVPEYVAPQLIVVHSLSALEGVEGEQAVRALYAYHCLAREWGDLGYHYLVDSGGTLYEGRAGGADVVGRHADRFDYGSMGVALMLGDGDGLSQACLDGASTLLAETCQANIIDPLGVVTLFDTQLPALASRAEALDEAGDLLASQMPLLRQSTLDEMGGLPPNLWLRWPLPDDSVSGVVEPVVEASAVITRAEGLIDGNLVYASDEGVFSWRWNTLSETEETHSLRLVAYNGAGQASVDAQLVVDNTPPTGSVSAPDWSQSSDLNFSLASDADWVQFSNGWWWEGEELHHATGSGSVIEDPDAINGLAWLGQGSVDEPGGWFGPYTCALPVWSSYDVVYRVKTDDRNQSHGLATLDVVDNKGQRVYAQRALATDQLASNDVYEDAVLTFDYETLWPTCDAPEDEDGLEFRTWYSGLGDLYLDRVSVFAQRVPMASEVAWSLPDAEGRHAVRVRFSDDAGNALEQEIVLGTDWSAPIWSDYGSGQVTARDATSGLDADSAAYALSVDGGATWGEWQQLAMGIVDGSTALVGLTIPVHGSQLARVRVADMASNGAISEPISLFEPSPTPMPVRMVLPLISRVD